MLALLALWEGLIWAVTTVCWPSWRCGRDYSGRLQPYAGPFGVVGGINLGGYNRMLALLAL